MDKSFYFFNRTLYEAELKTKVLGSPLIYMPSAGSTNDEASFAAQKGTVEGALIIAGRQSSSRGRMGRCWHSPQGGLWMSLILRPPLSSPSILPLTVMAGGAVSSALEKLTGLPVKFHWINDIYISKKKAGGILIEGRYQGEKLDYLIMGMGINLNFSAKDLTGDLPVPPTSIMDEWGKPIDIAKTAAAIMNSLEEMYSFFLSHKSGEYIDSIKRRCITLGSEVTVQKREGDSPISAKAIDITPQGELITEGKNCREILSTIHRIHLK